jgi:hypothetical protein
VFIAVDIPVSVLIDIAKMLRRTGKFIRGHTAVAIRVIRFEPFFRAHLVRITVVGSETHCRNDQQYGCEKYTPRDAGAAFYPSIAGFVTVEQNADIHPFAV